MSIRRSSKKRGGTLSVAVIVVAFLIVMIFQIVQLKNKETAYAQQTAELNKQLKEETERTDEINALADYMQSDQYIEDMAKSKLGLAYDNEIIFKEKEN
ncbi:MAG: septum formation initiator family protein [Lachnospiraceae bacterium]|jgi:cell division protein DivIC|uniref:FtsB family cell division protein n=1 Tax=Agathobacter sp. TaxID=2021311 RepID=UPI0027FA8472|nr:septum formation initiator family protein [uncultured Agathobacter sp.]MBD8924610.1 septum formation initiator family protein [Agathobacter rectalis]MCI7113205.1 septum formation initiator family protein [Lachnobacterium sp.]MDD6137813.1 septum formation initiator family protein [Lachnospiraceae bacterium]MDY6156530.1 septum formation initiator family protein [Agathobacter sp.]MBD8925402.1 septum formation initiator family protein [Agathobacter rectalis]